MHPRSRAGFTLIELMIVMTLLSVLALGVAPVFRTSFSTARADNAARDLFAEIKSAQESAISGAIEHRIYLDTKRNMYWTARPTEGRGSFAPVQSPGTDAFRVPERLRIDKVKGRKGGAQRTYYLAFYPSGTCDAGTISLVDAADPRRKYTIETTGTRATLALPESRR